MDNLTGTIIKDYIVGERIGVGGFGVVYKAVQRSVSRDVAMKVILPQYASRPRFIRDFEYEAQLVARLEHPYIVPLFDHWREGDVACIVMRFLRGGSLYDALRKDGALPLERAALVLDQIAAALTEAHRQGVVHQDLKTANILLDETGNAYLTDFGIAKDLLRAEPAPEEAAEAADEGDRVHYGSPEYMAPEQILRLAVDARTDIYSLGVVLYEMLTGKPPFHTADDEELIRSQLYKPLPPLQQFKPDLPENLNIVIQRATDKHPKKRYMTALEMAENFRQFAALPTVTVTAPKVERAPQLRLDQILAEPANPYKGLQPFTEADAGDFFGREALVEFLFRKMTASEDSAAGPQDRILAVVGPSGSGKSSIVRAGLLPLLRRSVQDRFIQHITPGPKPVDALAETLLKISLVGVAPFAAMIRESTEGFHHALTAALAGYVRELVLLIDQFEEVFTLVTDEKERAFVLQSLTAALRHPQSKLRLVITLRADFYNRPLEYRAFGELMAERTVMVLPMSDSELERAIVKPAERAGMTLEDGLAKAIVEDVRNQPGSLPLLQYALRDLFQNRRGKLLTLKAYMDAGGVYGAMTQRADELFLPLSPENKAAVQQVFLRLVTPGDGTEDTRRRALVTEILALDDPQRLRTILDLFTRHRLLSSDHEPQTRIPTVEIAHEALIRTWERLRAWLNVSRADLRLRQMLSNDAAAWRAENRDPEALARGGRLAQYELLLGSATLRLTSDEHAYLQASIARRQRGILLRRLAVAAVLLVALATSALAIFALDRERAARLAQRDSYSRELATQALSRIEELDLSLLLSLEALNVADTPEARATLLYGLNAQQIPTRRLERFLAGHGDPVRVVALAGGRMATGDAAGTLYLWDSLTDREPLALEGHAGALNALHFDADGQRLYSAGYDATLRVWDGVDGTLAGTLPMGEAEIWCVAVGGGLVAAGDDDGAIYLWDAATLEQRLTVRLPIPVYSMALAPAGGVLAVGGGDGSLTLLDTATGEILARVQAHEGGLWALAYDPRGRLLVSGGEDNAARLWAAAALTPVGQPYTGHTNVIRDAAFHPNGTYFVTGGDDGALIVWDIRSSSQDNGFRSIGSAPVRDLAFDGTTLLAASQLRSGLMWRFDAGSRLAQRLDGHTLPIAALDVDEGQIVSYGGTIEGGELLTWTGDSAQVAVISTQVQTLALDAAQGVTRAAAADRAGVITIYQDGSPTTTLEHDGRVFSLALEGNRLAVGGDGTIHLYGRSATGWTLERTLTGHTRAVLALRFARSGDPLLASGSLDNTARLWDAATGQQLAQVTHADPVMSVAVDGARLASGDRAGVIRLLTPERGEARTLAGHSDWVMGLDFYGDLLASGSRDRTVALWSVRTGRMMGTPLAGHTGEVTALAFMPDGQQLITGDSDGSLLRWDLALPHLRALACTIVGRDFTADEQAAYLREDSALHARCP